MRRFRDGIRPFALADRLGSADFVGGRVLQQSGERLQQRIGGRDLDVAALAEVGVGVPAIAQSPVGHRQRIVEARGLRLERERGLQMGDRLRVLLPAPVPRGPSPNNAAAERD